MFPLNVFHVTEVGDVRPMLLQYFDTERFVLNLPDDFHTGAFETEIKPADTGEHGTGSHFAVLLSSSLAVLSLPLSLTFRNCCW